MSLQWAAEAMGARCSAAGVSRGVCTDTRDGASGCLFFALRGERADGHNYVRAALANGAVAAVTSHELPGESGPVIVVPDTLRALGDLAACYRRRFPVPVIAVTGSVGKTSTKELITAALEVDRRVLASRLNFNNEIGVPLTLFNLERSHQVAVLELAMRGPGQIDRLAEIAMPQIGVITNIGLAHIELLRTHHAIAEAKTELLQRLPRRGVAVVPLIRTCPSHVPRAPGIVGPGDLDAFIESRIPSGRRRVTFAWSEGTPVPEADVVVRKTTSSRTNGLECVAEIEGARLGPFRLQAVGAHHIANVAAALAAIHALGVPLSRVLPALERWTGCAGRMTVLSGLCGRTVLDDTYNAGPESMEAALETLRSRVPKGGVAILGDMKELGEFTGAAHRFVARAAFDARLRLLVTVGDLASEIAVELRQISEDEHTPAPDVHGFADSTEAAAQICGLTRTGDTILVKGSRAMEMERVVQALAGLGPKHG